MKVWCRLNRAGNGGDTVFALDVTAAAWGGGGLVGWLRHCISRSNAAGKLELVHVGKTRNFDTILEIGSKYAANLACSHQ